MTTNQNHHDASSISTRTKPCDIDDMRSWSNLNYDMLSLVMMKLGVVDFIAFSGVCKPWRSVALYNKKMFMMSKPPMLMCISSRHNNIKEFYLEDHEGRKFKTILPNSYCRAFVGLTCGYLIFSKRNNRVFWLVNPITRHELHFRRLPCGFDGRSALVFSPSISRHVFVRLDRYANLIWYSIAGEGAWNLFSSTHGFHHLHSFKGKIYSINSDRCLCELTFNPEPNLVLLQTKNFPNKDLRLSELVSSGENLYFMKRLSIGGLTKVHKLDFEKMEWVKFKDTRDEHAFFLCELKYVSVAAVKPESWADPRSQKGRCRVTNESEHAKVFTANQWYFPHECLNVKSLK